VPRWQLFAGIDAAFSAGATAQADRASGQANLFGAIDVLAPVKPRYPRAGEQLGDVQVAEWPERVRLAFEKEALGFYLTGHPLAGHEQEVRRYASSTCAAVARKRHGDKVSVVAVVAAVRERMNKEKGTRFGFITLEDLTGTVEAVCWASRPASHNRPPQRGWADWEALATSDEPILVHGEVRINERDAENPRAEITVTELEALSAVRTQKTSEILLRVDADRLTRERAAELRTLLGRFPGACPVTVRAVIPEQSETTVSVALKAQPVDELIESARRLGFEVELR
jgi:DNA polymerase-3 subunit alpha